MANPYIRVRLLGVISSGETWSVNPCFIPNFDTQGWGQADLDDFAAAIAALNSGEVVPGPLLGLMGGAGAITGLRVEYYETGTTMTLLSEISNLAQPGTGTPHLPGQIALVSSLLSGLPGGSYRGRLYWPAMGAVIDDTTLRLDTPTPANIAGSVADWLSDIAAAATGGHTLAAAIYSKTRGAGVAVTSVRVGDVLDTQRRRRDDLVEAYTVVPI